jgi:hypothetical protein
MRGIHQPYLLTLCTQKVHEYEILTMEKERELALRYRMGDAEAGHAIINANLRLPLRIGRAYFHHDQNPLEIIQAGNTGLIKALETFDPYKDIRFSHHATWWVHKHIWNFVHASCSVSSAPSAVMAFSFPRRAKVFVQRGLSWISSLMDLKIVKNNIKPFYVRHLLLRSSMPARGHLAVVKNGPWKDPSLRNVNCPKPVS